MRQNQEEAIKARAYQLWEEGGRMDGRHGEHWHQAQLEYTAAESLPLAAASLLADAADIAPARPVRKKAVKAVAPKSAAALPAATRKVRAPRQTPASVSLN